MNTAVMHSPEETSEEYIDPSETDQVTSEVEEATGASDTLDLKVVIRPDTLKKLKILAILSSPEIVEQLKAQLEEQVNHAFDALITDEMMRQLKTSGMINENVKYAQKDEQAPEHELSDDEAEDTGDDEVERPKKPQQQFQGRIINPDPEAELLRPNGPRFQNVDEDADAYLDTIFGQQESNDIDRPSVQKKSNRRKSENEAFMQAAGIYKGDTGVSKASKSFSGAPRASVKGFDGDED